MAGPCPVQVIPYYYSAGSVLFAPNGTIDGVSTWWVVAAQLPQGAAAALLKTGASLVYDHQITLGATCNHGKALSNLTSGAGKP